MSQGDDPKHDLLCGRHLQCLLSNQRKAEKCQLLQPQRGQQQRGHIWQCSVVQCYQYLWAYTGKFIESHAAIGIESSDGGPRNQVVGLPLSKETKRSSKLGTSSAIHVPLTFIPVAVRDEPCNHLNRSAARLQMHCLPSTLPFEERGDLLICGLWQ
ncbi:hypothetical protein SEMRO_1894_G303951.1 [Seminavis robusta]|uniref:Uncharacterized protein n=1 Tax=Seminavis robusta TaxID=568900 RepID=A0A9N8EWF9_9STRA|nr:hypothetical protein SEMRO_1894_G303951.1 [Seminavis robusta]|eukprot:Sro1894_g303951.1  (156) ;mRNA; r:16630-17097